MLDAWLREHLESQAIADAERLLPGLNYNRRMHIAHYVFSLFAFIVAFWFLFFAHVLAAHRADISQLILMIGIICSAFFVVVSQFLKRNATFLGVLIRGHSRISSYVKTRTFFDPLYYQFHVTLLLLCLPLLVLWVVTVVYWTGDAEVWVSAGSEEHARNLEAIKQFMSLALAITSAQLALFMFMFSYLLGRYSSRIVKSLITHRTILGAWISSIGALTLLCVYFSHGYPRIVQTLITPIFAATAIICLIITIWVCISGIHPERAVLYSGARFARSIRRRVKKSTLLLEGKPTRFWAALGWLGLDWRDPERLKLYEPPRKGPPLVSRYLASLFNAANKAIEENQQDLLSHSLIAILSVLQSYVKIRKTYYGTRDTVLTEANDQMAALLKAACRSSNEYLPTLVVRCIGSTGALSLQIAERPPLKEAPTPLMPVAKRHELSLFWAGLLREAFELTHRLQRTTAAYEAVWQLTVMGGLSFWKEYYDTMATTFFSNIQEMHATAVKHADAGHRELGRKCLEAVMRIMALASQDVGKYTGASYRTFDQCLTTLGAMARGQFVLDAPPDFNLNGCGSILTSKSSHDHIVLQDIFYATLSRPVSETWQRNMTMRDLSQILKLVGDLASVAVSSGAADNGIFVTSFYEMAFLILRGLPPTLETAEESEEADPVFACIHVPPQDDLDSEVFSIWRELFSLFFNSRIMAWDWESYMCALLGIGFCNLDGRGSDVLRNQLFECVHHLRDAVVKAQSGSRRNVDHWWPYLQLLGAWISGFASEGSQLSEQIAAEVGRLRPFHSSLHGYSGYSQFEPYGYPAIWHGDFGLPRPRNLEAARYITAEDTKHFIAWQARLMNKELLLAYHEEVEKTRDPLRKEFHEQQRKNRTESGNPEHTGGDEHVE